MPRACGCDPFNRPPALCAEAAELLAVARRAHFAAVRNPIHLPAWQHAWNAYVAHFTESPATVRAPVPARERPAEWAEPGGVPHAFSQREEAWLRFLRWSREQGLLGEG